MEKSAYFWKFRRTIGKVGAPLEKSAYYWKFQHTIRNFCDLLKCWHICQNIRTLYNKTCIKITSVQGWASSYSLHWQKFHSYCSSSALAVVSPQGVDPSSCRCWVPATVLRSAYMGKRSRTGPTWSYRANVLVLSEFSADYSKLPLLSISATRHHIEKPKKQKLLKLTVWYQFFHFQLQITKRFGDLLNALKSLITPHLQKRGGGGGGLWCPHAKSAAKRGPGSSNLGSPLFDVLFLFPLLSVSALNKDW